MVIELFNISIFSVLYLQLIGNNEELRAILMGFSKEGFVFGFLQDAFLLRFRRLTTV